MTQLFLDLDGVLADFDAGVKQALDQYPAELSDHEMWRRLKDFPHLYRDLPPMPRMDELWSFCKKLNPIILSGVPYSFASASADKRAWVTAQLGRNVRLITCQARDKCLHMIGPGDVLVDDRPKYAPAWEARGGIFLVYTPETLSSVKSQLLSFFPTLQN